MQKIDTLTSQVPEFQEIAQRDPGAKNWLYVMQKLLPEKLLQTSDDKLKAAVQASFPEKYDLTLEDLSHGVVEFKNMPNINRIVGSEIRVPTLSFSNIGDYKRFMWKIGYYNLPQGVSIYLNFENFLLAIGINSFPKPLKAIRLVAYSEEQISGAMPPAQILRHEAIHGIDPLLEVREDEDCVILGDMIAAIGEFASQKEDNHTLNSYASFWKGYLGRKKGF